MANSSSPLANMGMNRLVDRMFRPVDNVVWDMMTGRIGFATQDGICSIDLGSITPEGEAPDAQVVNNMFDEFGFTVPAFAQNTGAEAINVGDMIYNSANKKVLGWVVKKFEKKFKLMKLDGTRGEWVPPKTTMFGFDGGVMVVRSLMNMLPGGQQQLSSMNNMMMMLPMMSGMIGGTDNDTSEMMNQILPMLLFSQMQSPTADPNASTNMMMQMMQMQMMSRMFGNNRGAEKRRESGSSNQPLDFFDRRSTR